MDGSTKITDAKNSASASTPRGTKDEEDNTSIGDGSHNQQSKQKRSHHCNRDGVRTDRRSRSRRDLKSRRYYSDDDSDSSGGDSSTHRRRRKKRKKKKAQKEKRRSKRKERDRRKRRKRRRSYSSSSSSSSSISDDASISSSSISDRKRKKKRRRNKRRKRHEKTMDHDNIEPQSLLHKQEQTKATIVASALPSGNSAKPTVPKAPIIEPKKKAMIPMSKEEYDKEQSKVREVYDPLSGRVRLVKGSGEIIERIVSSATHRQINSLATSGDGYAFSKGIYDKLNK